MVRSTELEECLAVLPVNHGSTMANDATNLTKGFSNPLVQSQFEEGCLAIYLASFSATPANATVKVELLHSDDNVAANYVVPEEPHQKVFGATADGGGGEALAANVLKFFFAPGHYKKWIRFRITLDTTAGTETATYSAMLILGAPMVAPVTDPVPATVLVTPS